MTGFEDIHGRDASWTVRDGAAHSRSVRAMFARIARVYDFMNHLLSLNRDRAWRRRVASLLDEETGEILDLCAGTGDLALETMRAGKGRAWVAADVCPEMLAGAVGKRGAERLSLAAADAMALPLRPRSVDAVVVGFGVRNFADVQRGVQEIERVLRPGGQLLVLDFFRDDPDGTRQAKGVASRLRILLNTFVPLVGRLVGRDGSAYRYLSQSMGAFLTPREFAELLQEHGFTEPLIDRQTFGIAHIVGARRKE